LLSLRKAIWLIASMSRRFPHQNQWKCFVQLTKKGNKKVFRTWYRPDSPHPIANRKWRFPANLPQKLKSFPMVTVFSDPFATGWWVPWSNTITSVQP
jgi:hypothetical protein